MRQQFIHHPIPLWTVSLMILAGSAVLCPAESLEEELFAGARSGTIKTMLEALGQGARFDGVDLANGETPLIASLPFHEATALLLERGADPNQAGADSRKPLEIALETGNSRAIKALLEAGAETKEIQLEGRPALLTLASIADFQSIRLLVEQGASPLVRDPSGNTIAMILVQSIAERHRYRELELGELLAWLKEHGLTYQAENGNRETVATIALKNQFRLLLEQTDFDDRFEKQANALPVTPPELWFAMAFQQRDVASILKLLPAVDLRRFDKLTDQSVLLAAFEMNSLPIFQALLSAGLNWKEAEDGQGEGVFFKAARLGKRDFARALLSAGANPNTLDRSGVCGAFGAALAGDLSLVQQFVTSGTSPNHANPGGFSLLMCAVYSGNFALVDYLLKQGADPAMKSSDGKTALDIAVARRDVPVVRLLDRDGAQKEWLKPYTHTDDRAFVGTWNNGKDGFDAMKLDLKADGTGALTTGFGNVTGLLWRRNPAFTISLLIRPKPESDQLLEVPCVFDVTAVRLILDFGNKKEALARGNAPVETLIRPAVQARVEQWKAGKNDEAQLSLAAMELRYFPLELLLVDRLKYLDLSQNNLDVIPESIVQLNKLQSIRVVGNQLAALPQAVANLRQLRELRFDQNRIIRLPGDLSRLEVLEILGMENNRLGDLPSGFGNLKSLRIANLASNRLRTLPDNLGLLRKLEELDLRRNALTSMPSNLAGLNSLKTLRLGSNHFEEFPVPVTTIQGLTTLDLANNRLKSLPPDLLKLQKLETLDLRFNRLEKVPVDLLKMDHLKFLLMVGNPLPESERNALRKALPKTKLVFGDEKEFVENSSNE